MAQTAVETPTEPARRSPEAVAAGCASVTQDAQSSGPASEGSLSMRDPAAEIGQGLLFGGYRIEASLGRGGMGEVFLAWDERLHRHVAIKRIRADLPVEAARRRRFRREARAVARLSHPAIVQVFDLLVDSDEAVGDCLVMERVEGRSLAQAIADGEVDLEMALRLASEIADGLAEAHGQGLVHRDLKPENVLVTRSGHAKILDFGLARILWDDAPEEHGKTSSGGLTQAGTLVGTVHAMSPEQASGRVVDHRSDLFALGSLLYEMLTRRAPFRGVNWLDSLRMVTGVRPEPLALLRPDLPTDLVLLVESLLEKEPDRRPANARVVADELEQMRRRPLEAPAPEIAAKRSSVPPSGSDLAELATGEWPLPARTSDNSQGYVEKVIRALLRTEPAARDALLKRHGEATVAKALARHDRKLRDLVTRHGGVEVEKGDAFLALFDRPSDAVACALAHHRALAELSSTLGWTLEARTAIHLGDVLLRHNPEEEISRGARPLEVEGRSKATAGHLGDLARPGQTLLTRTAFDLARRAVKEESGEQAAEPEDGPKWLAHGPYFVTGIDEPLEIFEVGVEGLAPLEAPADSKLARRVLSTSEERMLGWRPAVGQEIPLRENWTLMERLGEGGFGEVWLAQHRSGERRVFKFCFEAARLRALKREVTLFRLLKETLGHRDDIARILDWHFDEAPYFVESEYTEGGSLPAWAEEHGGLDQVPLATRLELAAEVADALAAAHSVGVLHKDVKPDNVLITTGRAGNPHARLTDFGIGLLTDRQRLDDPGFTALGFTATVSPTESAGGGTYGYLAPELMAGKPATVQADIYSLGVLLFQLVVADTSRTLAPGWERDVADPLLAEDLAEMLDGKPERRPASCHEVAKRLRTLEQRRLQRSQELASKAAFENAQRRRRLATVVASVSLVVLAIVAVMAWRESRARRDAEAARERAALRQEQAEGLIGFMLGDLREKLDGVGRLDVLDSVGEQAMEYFAAVSAEDLSDEELSRRAQTLYQIGDVRVRRGHLAAAEEAFEESLALSHEIVERNPTDAESLASLANSYFYVGAGFWEQSALDVALGYFQKSKIAAARLVELHPHRTEFKLELAYGEGNVGRLLEAMGRPEEALRHYTRRLEMIDALAQEDPLDLKLQSELAYSNIVLGSAQEKLGRLNSALEFFRKGLKVQRRLVEWDPQNTQNQEALHTGLSYVGGCKEILGMLDEAAVIYREALGIAEHLASLDPENAEWQRDLALALRNSGRLATHRGESQAVAVRYLLRALEALEGLSTSDRSRPRWRIQAAKTRIDLAVAKARNGQVVEALKHVRVAESAFDDIPVEESSTEQIQIVLAWTNLLKGKLEADSGRLGASEVAWLAALAHLSELDRESSDPQILAPLAVALARTRDPAAEAVRSRLESQNFAGPTYEWMIGSDNRTARKTTNLE